MTPIEEIAAERKRQQEKEGWSLTHDDDHTDGSLAAAAATYAYYGSMSDEDRRRNKSMEGRMGLIPVLYTIWPSSWNWRYWNPKSRRRDLVRAGALIVAELERLNRVAAAKATEAA